MDHIEFERRFLIEPAVWQEQKSFTKYPKLPDVFHICQGYVCSDDNAVVRIRKSEKLTGYGPAGFPMWYLTIKKDTGQAGKCFEFEYRIENGQPLFDSVEKKIEKLRHVIILGDGLFIEVDEFMGKHHGLVIAEVEFPSEAHSAYLDENMPSWFGEEVTGNRAFSNYQLCKA